MMAAAEARAAMRAFPVLPFEAIFGTAPILILAPHPDDESLGCGGTIAEACARGHPVHVAILTDGGMSHPGSLAWPRSRLVRQRRAEATAAVERLGLAGDRLSFLDAPDGLAPHDGPAFDSLLARLRELCEAAGAGTVCASWLGDPHGDHGSAAKLAADVSVQLGIRHLSYPVWGLTLPDDAPVPWVSGGARLDVSRHLAAKRQAIAAHATQHAGLIDDDPGGFVLPDSFLALFDGPFETFIGPE